MGRYQNKQRARRRAIEPRTEPAPESKILRAENHYGLGREPNGVAWIEDRLWKDLYFKAGKSVGDMFLKKYHILHDRQDILQNDPNFQLHNPIMIYSSGVIKSAGQRLWYGHTHGYAGIECVACDNPTLQALIFDVQRAWAKGYFPEEVQETVERKAPDYDDAMTKLTTYLNQKLHD